MKRIFKTMKKNYHKFLAKGYAKLEKHFRTKCIEHWETFDMLVDAEVE